MFVDNYINKVKSRHCCIIVSSITCTGMFYAMIFCIIRGWEEQNDTWADRPMLCDIDARFMKVKRSAFSQVIFAGPYFTLRSEF